MTPLKALREFFARHTDLKPLSTQHGLSKLVQRSESLIRAVESGRSPMSQKLARDFSTRIGVSEVWLMEREVDGGIIPGIDGKSLDHVGVLAKVHDEISSNLAMPAQLIQPANTAHQRLAQAIAKLVADEILEYLKSPSADDEEDPINHILEWLRSRADKRAGC